MTSRKEKMEPIKNVGELKKFLENISDDEPINLCVLEKAEHDNILHVGNSAGNGIGAILIDGEGLELHAVRDAMILL